MEGKYYKKYIRIPPNETVDVRGILPIVNHPRFQRLLYVGQLGATLRVFPGASHNRFEHALGVYSKTVKFCVKLVEEKSLTPKEAKNVSLFALIHDIGHGPFSHLIEELTPYDHDKNGLTVLDELKDVIKQSGGDIALIRKIFARQNPLYRIVMDKNLGMDKLDYLDRDTFHTGFGQRPDVATILDYLNWIDNRLVVDKKSLEAAKQIQRLYLYMFREVYLHKSSLIAQRFLQKMFALYLSLRKINPKELWALNDAELMAKIYTDPDARLKFLYTSYLHRVLPSTGLVFRINTSQHKERLAGKHIKIIGQDQKFFEKFSKIQSPADLEKIENIIAQALKVPPYMILVVPTLSLWRFVPEDVFYHDEGRILSLRVTQSEYFESMGTELSDYLAVRVCIVGDRRLIYNNAAKISRLIKNSIL